MAGLTTVGVGVREPSCGFTMIVMESAAAGHNWRPERGHTGFDPTRWSRIPAGHRATVFRLPAPPLRPTFPVEKLHPLQPAPDQEKRRPLGNEGNERTRRERGQELGLERTSRGHRGSDLIASYAPAIPPTDRFFFFWARSRRAPGEYGQGTGQEEEASEEG